METKLKIIMVLEENKKGIHLRALSRVVGTGLPNIMRYIKIFEKEGVVKREKQANTIKVTLKAGVRTVAYLKQVNSERFLTLPKNVQVAITDFLGELEDRPILSLVFGSYAKNNYRRDSDLDLLIIFQEVKKENHIENIARRISMRNNIKINPIYVEYSNFKRNFFDKDHNFSEEIRNNVIVLNGLEEYYSLLWGFLR